VRQNPNPKPQLDKAWVLMVLPVLDLKTTLSFDRIGLKFSPFLYRIKRGAGTSFRRIESNQNPH